MSKHPTVKLEDLVGFHMLFGVDKYVDKFDPYDNGHFEDASCIRFCLDLVTYTAVEDPEDGYRSSLKEIFVSDDVVKNAWPGVPVVAALEEDEHSHILVIVDQTTRQAILRIGTDNTDDYYPSFIGHFQPEALVHNHGKPKP